MTPKMTPQLSGGLWPKLKEKNTNRDKGKEGRRKPLSIVCTDNTMREAKNWLVQVLTVT